MIISIFLFFSMKSIARWSQRIVSMSTFWERDILADVGEHVTHAVIQLKFKHFSPWVSFARFIPFFTPMCLLHTKKIFFHYQQQHNNNGNVLKSSIFVWFAGKNETELSCEQGDAMGGTMKNKYYHCESEAEIANLNWDIQAWCRDYNWMAGSYVISWCRFIKSSTLEMQIRPDTACVYVYWDEEGGGKNRLFDWTTSCMPDYS